MSKALELDKTHNKGLPTVHFRHVGYDWLDIFIPFSSLLDDFDESFGQ